MPPFLLPAFTLIYLLYFSFLTKRIIIILLIVVQDGQAGVVPKSHFYPRSQSHDRDRDNNKCFRTFHSRSNGHSSRGNSVNGRQESQCSEESESGKLFFLSKRSSINLCVFACRSRYFGIFHREGRPRCYTAESGLWRGQEAIDHAELHYR